MIETFNCFPISGMVLSDPLNEKDEVLEVTFNSPIFDRALIISSVIPSEKYSKPSFELKFKKGNTAMLLFNSGFTRLDYLTGKVKIAFREAICFKEFLSIERRLIYHELALVACPNLHCA